MPRDEKARKVKGEKQYTRIQAEKALSRGEDPQKFVKHANYHVRYKAWRKLGSPLPASEKEVNDLLVTLQGKPLPKESDAVAAFYAGLRQKLLKELPPAPPEPEAVQTDDRNDPPALTEPQNG